MPNKEKGKKRKNRSSGSANDKQKSRKTYTEGGPSDLNLSVSELLKRTNHVLYSESNDGTDNELEDSDSVFDNSQTVNTQSSQSSQSSQSRDTENMASGGDSNAQKQHREPTNSELMTCLLTLDTKLNNVNKRLDDLEEVKKKVDGFDQELRKIWVAVTDNSKKTEERMNRVEEKVESSDFSVGLLSDRVTELEKQKEALKGEIVYLQGQSMRNNLVFTGIPEEATEGVIETNEMAEEKVRVFIREKMKVAEEVVNKIVFDRVHRMGQKQPGRARKIVAKFHEYKEKEMVRKQWKSLEGTPYYVNEQLPKEVVDKRKRLLPRMKAAREQGKRAWLAYDTLYIDGKAQKE